MDFLFFVHLLSLPGERDIGSKGSFHGTLNGLIPIFCSGPFTLNLSIKMNSLESCVGVCWPAQGTVSRPALPPDRLHGALDSCDIIPQGHPIITHPSAVT